MKVHIFTDAHSLITKIQVYISCCLTKCCQLSTIRSRGRLRNVSRQADMRMKSGNFHLQLCYPNSLVTFNKLMQSYCLSLGCNEFKAKIILKSARWMNFSLKTLLLTRLSHFLVINAVKLTCFRYNLFG